MKGDRQIKCHGTCKDPRFRKNAAQGVWNANESHHTSDLTSWCWLKKPKTYTGQYWSGNFFPGKIAFKDNLINNEFLLLSSTMKLI